MHIVCVHVCMCVRKCVYVCVCKQANESGRIARYAPKTSSKSMYSFVPLLLAALLAARLPRPVAKGKEEGVRFLSV